MFKKALAVLSIVLLPSIAFAGGGYQHIQNAAIQGHNALKLTNVSVQMCKKVCNGKSWCQSFDYNKKKNMCELSKSNYRSTGLKSNYRGNPYDHYSKIPVSYQRIQNAAIQGHNTQRLTNVSVQACKAACTGKNWCQSFDYYKKQNMCDLSKANYRATGLKSNYPGNPYDHYSKQ